MVNQEAVQFTLKETEPPSPPTAGSYDEDPKLIDDDSDNDEDDSQPQQGPAPHEDDFDDWQSHADEQVDGGPDDLLYFAGGDMNMRDPTDNEEEESITESDSEMPGAAPSQTGIKWVRWDGDESESDSAVGSDSIHDFDSDFDELEGHE